MLWLSDIAWTRALIYAADPLRLFLILFFIINVFMPGGLSFLGWVLAWRKAELAVSYNAFDHTLS